MSDPINPVISPDVGAEPASPGQTIRQAREALGLHIVALAAALKVPVRKLEALEANRWEELTDATFTRALASSVARHLKIDAAPVLMGLPSVQPVDLNSPIGLGQVGQGGTPVSMAVLRPPHSLPRHTWAIALLLVGTVALYFSPQLPIPALWLDAVAPTTAERGIADVPLVKGVSVDAQPLDPVQPKAADKPVAASAPEPLVPLPVSGTGTGTVVTDSTSAESLAPKPPVGAIASADGAILFLAAALDTWVEVTDSSRRLRIQRVLKQGEDAIFAEGAPFSVVVGNAAGARVVVRGQPFDLVGIAKNNVARFDVK